MAAADSHTRASALARARKQGIVVRSADLSTACALLALGGFALAAHQVVDGFLALVQAGLGAPAAPTPAIGALVPAVGVVAALVTSLLGALLLAAALAVLVQGVLGGASAGRPVRAWLRSPFRWSMQEGQGLVALWSTVKAGVLLLLALRLFRAHSPHWVSAMDGDLQGLVANLTRGMHEALPELLWVTLLLAAIDLWVQRQSILARVRVDPWVERRRRRAEEGDPYLRGQVRSRMRRAGAPDGSGT